VLRRDNLQAFHTVVSNSSAYLEGFGFDSRPGYRISWLFSACPKESYFSPYNMPRPFHSTHFHFIMTFILPLDAALLMKLKRRRRIYHGASSMLRPTLSRGNCYWSPKNDCY